MPYIIFTLVYLIANDTPWWGVLLFMGAGYWALWYVHNHHD